MLALAVFHEAKKPTYLFLRFPSSTLLSLSLSSCARKMRYGFPVLTTTMLSAKGTSTDIENDRAKGQVINCPAMQPSKRNKVRTALRHV